LLQALMKLRSGEPAKPALINHRNQWVTSLGKAKSTPPQETPRSGVTADCPSRRRGLHAAVEALNANLLLCQLVPPITPIFTAAPTPVQHAVA
jgi:hypothetical protein